MRWCSWWLGNVEHVILLCFWSNLPHGVGALVIVSMVVWNVIMLISGVAALWKSSRRRMQQAPVSSKIPSSDER